MFSTPWCPVACATANGWADHADRHALDREGGFLRIDDDRRERRVLGHQRDFTPAAFQPFDRHFLAQPRDHDLPAARVVRLVHDEEVAVEDAGVLHAGALHAQQVVGMRREQRGVDAVLRLDVFGGEDGAAGRHPAHQRQQALDRHAGNVAQPQAAGGAGRQFERAFSGQRLQVVFRRAGGGEAQAGGDFRARGRHAGGFHVPADPVEDLLLARGEARGRRGIGGGAGGRRHANTVWICGTVIIVGSATTSRGSSTIRMD
jgi:hypothetical protein